MSADSLSRREILGALGAIYLAGCGATKNSEVKSTNDAHDVHSFGEPDKVRVRNLALDLAVSFDSRTLAGTAILGIEQIAKNEPLKLDTRDLTIESIESSADGSSYALTPWEFGQKDPILGTPLSVTIPPEAKFIRIRYSSQPQATGLQWLEPQQTAGKKHPFLFSQNESIHARSWIPIQDSPGVRISYTARIRVHQNEPDGIVALMSAEHKGTTDEVFEFAMDTSVPPYLIALAVGDLKFQSTGPRTGVWAEPPVIAKAAAEFSDTEKMIDAVEQIYGPYRWGRYDLLILPPSFPFGGMENPRLTFATPTILAGDKSLVGLVSHELAHSWSGNLVTNATWSDFWLNEAFTTYIENRIQEAVYGREQALMEQVLDRRRLDDELATLPPSDQIMYIDLKGRDPDEGSTGIPYNKGAALLRLMEQVFGREQFDNYLRGYFDHFAFQSITTKTMLGYMKSELLDNQPELAAKIPLDEWIYKPGLRAAAVRPTMERLTKVAAEAKAFAAGSTKTSAISTKQWSTQEWLEFLENMPALSSAQMSELDRAFHLTQTGNSEILDQWLEMAITADYSPAYPRLESFLMEVGRQKFIKPLYSALMKTPTGEKRARGIYAKARPNYHPIAQTAIDKIVGKP
jgi:aminopeptidase N